MLMRLTAAAALCVTLSATPATAQVRIDVNGDGVRDILLQDAKSKNVAVWLVDAHGQLTDIRLVGSAAQGSWSVPVTWCNFDRCLPSTDAGPWTIVGTRDVNADGVTDILLQSPFTTVIAWLMDGAGQPTSAVPVQLPSPWSRGDAIVGMDLRWRLAATVDLDGDGLADLVSQGAYQPGHPGGAGGVRARRMGSTTASSVNLYTYPYDMGEWEVVAAADVNGDGAEEILLQHPAGHVGAWVMDRGQPTDFIFVWPYGTDGWRVVGTIDLNGDATEDILLQYPTGFVAAWIMNAAGQPMDFAWVWPGEAGTWRVNGR